MQMPMTFLTSRREVSLVEHSSLPFQRQNSQIPKKKNSVICQLNMNESLIR